MIRWWVATVLTAVVVVVGLATQSRDDADQRSTRRTTSAASASASPSVEVSPTPSPSAAQAPVPRPEDRACYRLSFGEALSPVTKVPASSCERRHTARTLFVGTVGDLEGRIGAIDSPRVQSAVAADCPRRLSTFLGGPDQALRLSMFRPIWFTPTLARAETGEDWYRCDIIALAGEGELTPLEGRLEGLLGRLGWKERYGLCGTAEPGTPGFAHVSCARGGGWRALSTVPIGGERYPGEVTVRTLGDGPCTAAARDVAPDPLDFQWGFEWPTLEQWRAGRRYGVCWAPAASG